MNPTSILSVLFRRPELLRGGRFLKKTRIKPALLASGLTLCAAGPLVGQNAVTNGDFSSNAAAFTSFPGYVTGANPAEIDNWTRSADGLGINGVGISTPFGPANQSAATYYAFIQNGPKTLSQAITLAPSTSFDISFLAASRNGNGAAVGRVLVADNSTTYYDSTVTHWNTAAFQLVSGGFSTGAVIDGPVTITLSNDTVGGDNTVDYSNISITPAVPPTVLTMSPEDDATGVEAFTDLVLTFDKDIQKGVGNIVIKESVGDAIVESIDVTTGSVTVSGAQVTINPASDLAGNTGYYVQIDAGAIEGLSGSDYAGIGDTTTWSFTTGVVDLTAPTVSTLNPADDAGGVAVNTGLGVTFDEDVQKGTGNIELREAGGALVEAIDVTSGAVTISGAEALIDLASSLSPITAYYIQIPAGVFKDLAGNDYAGIADTTTWNFATGEAPVFNFVQVTNDADSGVDSSNTYSHAIDFGNGAPALVNGVQFVQEMGTAAGAITNTGVRVYGPNIHGGNGPPAVSGSIADVFRDMRFNGPDLGTVELTGLIPGAQYDLRFYDRAWDHNGTVRTVAFSYDIDSDTSVEFTSPTFDTNRPQDAPTSLGGNVSWVTSYLYTAGANGSILVTLDINPAATYHIYGLTNQLIPGLSIDAAPLAFTSAVGSGDLVSSLSAALTGVPEATTFTLDAGVGDADNGKFQISGSELQSNGYNFAGDPDGTTYSVRILGTGDAGGETDARIFTLTMTLDDDGDGLPDSWEIAKAGNTTDLSGVGGADFDGDGLSDLEEYNLSLGAYPNIDPTLADTDTDGLGDGDEVNGTAGSRPATDPTNADTDGDNLSDLVETNTGNFANSGDTGTDPTAADSDGDTVPDGVEVANGSDPNNPLDFLPAAISVTKLNDDASSGIDAAKTYSHLISGGNAATVNGVTFEALTPTVTPANFDWTVTAAAKAQVLDNPGAWTPAAVGLSGTELEQLLDSFTYNGGAGSGVPGTSQSYTLSGLTVGQSYQLRLYIRVWDTGGSGRPIAFKFTNGPSVFDPNLALPEDRPGTVLTNGNDQCAYYISYDYVAQSTELVIDATVPSGGLGSYHMYGMSNEELGSTDLDGDGIPNLLDIAYGFDPEAADMPGVLTVAGGSITNHGLPTTVVESIPNGVDFSVNFPRRSNYASLGLSVAVQFSHDMITWFPGDPGAVIANDGGIDVVKVQYPFFLPNGRKARFWQVIVIQN